AAAPADDGASDGPPAWLFVAATTAIVAAGAVWAVRRRS
ncbi:copper resistance protein CopC, partial [Mycobacterium sp. ITM-2017-0098]